MEPPYSGPPGWPFFSKEVNKVQKLVGSCRVSQSRNSCTRQERKQSRDEDQDHCHIGDRPGGPCRTGFCRRRDPDRVGLGCRAARAAGALQHLHEEGQPQSPLRLHGERGQRRSQGRPERHQPVRRPGSHPAAQRRRDDLHQVLPRRALHRRQPEEQARQHQHPADPRHLPGAAHQLEPGSGLGPRTRRSTRSAATPTEGPTTSSSRRCSTTNCRPRTSTR